MSANLYAWEPRIGLSPRDNDFQARVDSLSDPSHLQPPSPVMRAFVTALLAHYPDLTVADDTPWADGPLLGDANGGFINVSLIWSRYNEARPFFLATAHRLSLDAYDPQDSRYFPANAPLAAAVGVALVAASVARTACLSRRDLLAAAAAGLV